MGSIEKAVAKLGIEWWSDKTQKPARLAAVKVSDDPTAFVLPSIGDMTNQQIIALAKTNGAPKTVTTGRGAGARSNNWIQDNGYAQL